MSFAFELAVGLLSPLPVAVKRWKSAVMRAGIDEVSAGERFDAIVCDFLAPAPNFSTLDRCVLFQHNVETMIWRRRAEYPPDPIRRAYLKIQAGRVETYEGEVCRKVKRVIAVSDEDSRIMREMFGIRDVPVAAPGVNAEYFEPRSRAEPASDLVFVGAMDWLPNIDGMKFFTASILPLFHRVFPECTVAIVSRAPDPEIRAKAAADPRITVTGTVSDVRQYLWTSKLSIVQLRIGSGTRLKIYESMAAACPVVSTTVGAEGLSVLHPQHIRLADTPEQFACECIGLLQSRDERATLADAAYDFVREHCSWDTVAREFEALLVS